MWEQVLPSRFIEISDGELLDLPVRVVHFGWHKHHPHELRAMPRAHAGADISEQVYSGQRQRSRETGGTHTGARRSEVAKSTPSFMRYHHRIDLGERFGMSLECLS